jgi:NAD(P)-dependent dehydrogenase (short-subunit alcohol dehydrogenase family)
MNQRTALLTGAAGGLGSCTARHLAERGWRVFATDIDRARLAALEAVDGITPLFLDVTDQATICAVCRQIEAQTEGLDGLVNFAGTIAMGPMVEMEEATLLHVINTNAMGAFRVNRTFFPLVLKRRGRIVNISSETGWQSGGPFNAAYAMSKHAIEAYSDSLRRELLFLGVPVIKIQPGPFKTEMVRSLPEKLAAVIEASTYFREVLTRMQALIPQEYEKANDPALVAQVVYEALTTARPKTHYSVKPDSQRTFLDRLPAHWADALYKKGLSG